MQARLTHIHNAVKQQSLAFMCVEKSQREQAAHTRHQNLLWTLHLSKTLGTSSALAAALCLLCDSNQSRRCPLSCQSLNTRREQTWRVSHTFQSFVVSNRFLNLWIYVRCITDLPPILTVKSSVTMQFLAARSRCTNLLALRYAIPSAISPAIWIIFFSGGKDWLLEPCYIKEHKCCI